ncbi:hypothetical protein D3C81_384680 [compost metagenome]
MIGPKDLHTKVSDIQVNNIIKLIDGKIESKVGEYKDRVEVIILGEYSPADRDKVSEMYTQPEVGWSKVTHRSSSENGEQPGLTRFTFYY